MGPIFTFIATVKDLSTERLALLCLLSLGMFMGWITVQVLTVVTDIRITIAEFRVTMDHFGKDIKTLQKGDPVVASVLKSHDQRISSLEREK